jgi:hypothetical protein
MSAETTLRLRTGVINHKDYSKNGRWVLFTTRDSPKTLAFDLKGLTEIPDIGDKVSVETTPWEDWDIGVHRSLVIVKAEPFFPVEGLSNNEPTRTGAVINMILDWLATHPQVTSDDIYDEAMRLYPRSDPRFIGHGFRTLAHRGIIHQVGMKKSANLRNHTRPQSVWEATKK